VARANKGLASRCYRLKTGGGHCLAGQLPNAGGAQYKTQTRKHLFENCPQWKSRQKALWATVLEETRKHPGPVRTRDRTKIAELFVDERRSKAILDFLATTDVGKTVGLPEAAAEEAGRGLGEQRTRGAPRADGGGRGKG